MQKPFLFFFSLLTCFFLSSCISQYGTNLTQHAVPIASDSCTKHPANVFLFYEAEPINFAYSRRCLVEVVGSEYSSDEELLNRLKYQAYLNCANAIIGLKSSYVSRETGFYNDPKTKRSYMAKVYNGLAVQIESDSLYKSFKYGDWRQVDYLSKVQGYVEKEQDEFVFKFVLGTMVFIAGLAYLISKS